MAKLISTPKRPRVITTILPIMAIAVLGYTGNTLLNARAAKDAAPKANLASATSACCHVSVNSAKRAEPTSERYIVNLTVRNISPNTLEYTPAKQFSLRNTFGAVHHPVDVHTHVLLQASTSRTESIEFKVPVNSPASTLVFKLDATTDPVAIELP
jgi:hypothetical protein